MMQSAVVVVCGKSEEVQEVTVCEGSAFCSEAQ